MAGFSSETRNGMRDTRPGQRYDHLTILSRWNRRINCSPSSRRSPLLELIFDLIAEFLLQCIVEALAEIGLHSTAKPSRKPPNPWLAAIGYAIFGATAGVISLFVLPESFVQGETWRVVNLAVTPVLAGLSMAALGAWRTRRGQQTLRLDRFSYGYLFALCMAIVRFHFAA